LTKLKKIHQKYPQKIENPLKTKGNSIKRFANGIIPKQITVFPLIETTSSQKIRNQPINPQKS